MHPFEQAWDLIVATVVATEVPPRPTRDFTPEMRELAIRCVVKVIENRVKAPQFPDTPVEVVLQPKAFSAVYLSQVSDRDYWIRACAGVWFLDHVLACLGIWRQRELLADPTNGATHYYSPISMDPPMSVPPWWHDLEEIEVSGLSGDYFRFARIRS